MNFHMMTDQSVRDGDSHHSHEEGKSAPGSFKSFRPSDQNTRFTFADRGEQQMSDTEIRIVSHSEFSTLNDRKHQMHHMIQVVENTSMGNPSEANRVDLIRDEEEEACS